MRIALLLAYDGSRYFGFVRQPDTPTVEGEIIQALTSCGLVSKLEDCWYRIATRTDRGVSALGQVIALNAEREPDLMELNSRLPEDIAFLSWTPVSSKFDPRREAVSKHYKYVCELPPGFDLELVREMAKVLEGTHDFRCFCKREPNRPTVASLMFAGVQAADCLSFDFVGPFFLRQQVRRMVEALLELGEGLISREWFLQAVEGVAPKSFKPAPAEGLFLAGIRYRKTVFQLDGGGVEKFVRLLKSKNDLRSREMLRFLLGPL